MGAVYLARDNSLDREVAIKTLPPEMSATSESRERFRREARIAARLNHPNIVPLHAFGEAEQILYYIMGFVRGETLAQRLERDRTIPSNEAQRILAQIADALSYAHELGVIHRDLKPENILLDDVTGRAVLADFGIARMATATHSLTVTGALVGTPRYMSPEQASGAPLDHRSDIYSLGVIGYRMLSGAFPFGGETFAELIAQQASRNPVPLPTLDPMLPDRLADAVMRCLNRQPVDRWATAAEFREALREERPLELPEPLEQIESLGVVGVLLLCVGLVFIPLELLYWSEIDPGWRLLIELVQLVPFLFVLLIIPRMAEARKHGTSWSTTTLLLFRAPRWYWGWVPTALRRPGDVWDRLPPAVRHFRNCLSVSLLLLFPVPVLVPLRILGNLSRTVGLLFVSPLAVGFLVMLITLIRAERALIAVGLAAADRSLLLQIPAWRLTPSRYPTLMKALSGIREPPVAEGGDQAVTVRRGNGTSRPQNQ